MELPDDRTLRDLVVRCGNLFDRFGADLGKRPLVLPNGRYFPDPFVGDRPSLARLVQRMQAHAGLADIRIEVELVDPEAADESAACGSGGCGSCAVPTPDATVRGARLVDLGDGWQLNLHPDELSNPVALTAGLARSLALVFLLEETSEARPLEEPIEITVELTAVALGLGSLLLSASHIYQKSCGGPRVSRLTELSVAELSIAFALWANAMGHPLGAAKSELEVTQRESLTEAETWARSNPALAKRLRAEPLGLALGDFTLSPPRSWAARMLGGLFGSPASSGA